MPDGEWFKGAYKVRYGEEWLDKFVTIIQRAKDEAKDTHPLLIDLLCAIIPLLPKFKPIEHGGENFEAESEYRIFSHDLGIQAEDKIHSHFIHTEGTKKYMYYDKIIIRKLLLAKL